MTKVQTNLVILIAALVDRLCYKSYLINMPGTLCQIKGTKKLANI